MPPSNYKKTADGRGLHLYGRGDAPLQESSESEEELPAPAPAPKAVFASILAEVRAGSQKKEARPRVHRQVGAADSDRSHIYSIATNTTIAGLCLAESQAGKVRGESINKVRGGYLRTTLAICGKQHKVLVCQWSFSDPINRKGTWSLEVLDFRRQLWIDDMGVEEHNNCHVRSLRRLLEELARSMVNHWEREAPRHIAREPDYHKRRLLKEQLESKQLPSAARIERELGPLAVYIMGSVSGHGAAGDLGDNENRASSERLNKQSLRKKTEEDWEQAELAQLKKKMEDQKQRKLDDSARLKRDQANRREVQKIANTPDVLYERTKKQRRRTSSRSPAPRAMTKEDEKLAKSIRAAAQKDREEQEEAEREEQRQQDLAAQEAELAAAEEDSSDDSLSAAMLDALENASPEREAVQEPARKLQAEQSSTTPPQVQERKRRVKRPARPIVDSSDSDSVPLPSSRSVRPKKIATPAIRKRSVSFNHLVAKLSGPGSKSALSKTKGSSGLAESKAKELMTLETQCERTQSEEGSISDSENRKNPAKHSKHPSPPPSTETSTPTPDQTITDATATLPTQQEAPQDHTTPIAPSAKPKPLKRKSTTPHPPSPPERLKPTRLPPTPPTSPERAMTTPPSGSSLSAASSPFPSSGSPPGSRAGSSSASSEAEAEAGRKRAAEDCGDAVAEGGRKRVRYDGEGLSGMEGGQGEVEVEGDSDDSLASLFNEC